MQSVPRRALTRLFLTVSMVLGLTACVSAPPINMIGSACSELLPADWATEGVPGAPLPMDQVLAEWVAFADAQTGQLDKANDRTRTGIGIIKRCEARDQAAYERARKRWWQVWK